jgi:hypothetical protein
MKPKYKLDDEVLLFVDHQTGRIVEVNKGQYWTSYQIMLYSTGENFAHDIVDDEIQRKISSGEAYFINEIKGQEGYKGSYRVWLLHEHAGRWGYGCMCFGPCDCRQPSLPEQWFWRPICEWMNTKYGTPVSAM